MVTHSANASDAIQLAAKEVFKKFIAAGSDYEVNISAKTRTHIESLFVKWTINEPLLKDADADAALTVDPLKRSSIFELASKEIRIMLYQNLWNKFRTQETIELAAGHESHNQIHNIQDV